MNVYYMLDIYKRYCLLNAHDNSVSLVLLFSSIYRYGPRSCRYCLSISKALT